MKIEGIGIVNKKEVMKILTDEGKEAVKTGIISQEVLANMYKFEMIKKASCIGDMPESFNLCYNRVPDSIKCLSPSQIADVVDAIYYSYCAGKSSK